MREPISFSPSAPDELVKIIVSAALPVLRNKRPIHNVSSLHLKFAVAVYTGHVLTFFRCGGACGDVNLLVDFAVWTFNRHLISP